MLFDSAFNRLQNTPGIFLKRELTADDIVGLAFSLSTTAPDKLGARKDAFEAELRGALAKLSPDSRFTGDRRDAGADSARRG